MFFAGNSFYFMKDRYINDLTDKKSNQTANDDPHTLTEYTAKCRLHIRNAIFLITDYPCTRRCGFRGHKKHEVSITDQSNRGVRNPTHSLWSVKFINNICHHEFQRP